MVHKPQKKKTLLGDENSQVEAIPLGSKPVAKRALGKVDLQDQVQLSKPVPKARGQKAQMAVGLRTATAFANANPETRNHREQVRARLKDKKAEKQKNIWDKIDTAKQVAVDHQRRVERFGPKRS